MKSLFATLLLLLCTVANAAPIAGGPTPGLWWNPDESGRGFTIEMQDSTMVVTSYVYNAQGAATWFVSAGRYDINTRTFTATLDANTGGQCFGCPYTRPQGIANAGGPLRIVFDSYTSATLYYQGGSSRIVRQMYGYATPLARLRGSFALSFRSGGLVIGDWLVFDRLMSGTSGPFAAGNFEGYPTTRIAVANIGSTGQAAFLVQIGTFYDFFIMDMDDYRLFGKGWTYQQGNNPTGSGSPAYGVRMKMPSEVSTSAMAPPAMPSLAAPGDLDLRIAAAKAASAEPAAAEVVQLAKELEAQLR